MKITEVRKGVVLVKFDTRYHCASTMMRMQEFYESPFDNIRGKYFTVEQYMDTYAEAKEKFTYKEGDYVYKGDKNFTYTLDWEAFNITGHIVVDFYHLFGDMLLEKEKRLFNEIVSYVTSGKKFYLIATYEDTYLGHELAHAYYYMHGEYCAIMDMLMSEFKRINQIKKCVLSSSGYSEGVAMDEVQAYLATGTVKSINADIGFRVSSNELGKFHRAFKLFDGKQK